MRTFSEEERQEYSRMLGSLTSQRKAAAARENGKKGGAPMKRLAEVVCTCGAGDSLEHRSTCPRGRRIRVRRRKGLPLV